MQVPIARHGSPMARDWGAGRRHPSRIRGWEPETAPRSDVVSHDLQVGPVGIEPTTRGLKVRCSAS